MKPFLDILKAMNSMAIIGGRRYGNEAFNEGEGDVMSIKFKQLGNLILILMASFFFAAPRAQAELVQIKSKVIEINFASNYLKVDRLNSSGEMEEIKIDIERSAHFEIYTSIQDVKVGDDVAIEADFNSFNHEWKALSIAPYNENSANKVLQANVQEAQVNPATAVAVKV